MILEKKEKVLSLDSAKATCKSSKQIMHMNCFVYTLPNCTVTKSNCVTHYMRHWKKTPLPINLSAPGD